MNGLMLTTALTSVCLLSAGVMGYAIQRGATCTVVAVTEILDTRRFGRLLAMLEASLWVLAVILGLKMLGLRMPMPQGYASTGLTVAGAALLGIGAAVNRACVFGAIARFGNGEWAYIATPPGFLAGYWLATHVFPFMTNAPLQQAAPALSLPAWAAATVMAVVAARVAWTVYRTFICGAKCQAGNVGNRKSSPRVTWAARAWHPYSATLVIGVTFIVLLTLAGAWTYTDTLADWALERMSAAALRGPLLLALFAGAALGGWTAGRFVPTRPTGTAIGRCALGGALMGIGSFWIPGGNDGLILTGLPLLWSYAWIAFCTMCVAIAAYQLLSRHVREGQNNRP